MPNSNLDGYAIPFSRKLMPPGYNAEAVAFTVAIVHERGDLNHKLLACLLAVVRHVNDETGLANVGYERLMALTGTKRPNTVASWLSELKELGYIDKSDRVGRNGSNVFTVPILTYLPCYRGVGVSETVARTTQSTTNTINENDGVGSMSNGKRYDDWRQPLAGRELAVEEAGEYAVVLSERFTQALIDHKRKAARYFTDAYRPSWLQVFIGLERELRAALHYEDMAVELSSALGPAEYLEIFEAELQSRFDAVFEYIAGYDGEDNGIKHLDQPEWISTGLFYDVLDLSGFSGQFAELRADRQALERQERQARLLQIATGK